MIYASRAANAPTSGDTIFATNFSEGFCEVLAKKSAASLAVCTSL